MPVALGGTGQPLPDGQFTGTAVIPGVLLYPDEIAQIDAFIVVVQRHHRDRDRQRRRNARRRLCGLRRDQGPRLPHRRHRPELEIPDRRHLFRRRVPSLVDRLHDRGRRVHPGDERTTSASRSRVRPSTTSSSRPTFPTPEPRCATGEASGTTPSGCGAQLLTTTNAARGFALQMPEALEQPTRGRGPRKVDPGLSRRELRNPSPGGDPGAFSFWRPRGPVDGRAAFC